MRNKIPICLAALVLLASIASKATNASVYFVATRRWFSSRGTNEPLQVNDVIQYSHCASDGWSSASDACVRRYYGAWNGVSEYYITDGTNSYVAHVDWGVGNTYDPYRGTYAVAIMCYNSNGSLYTDEQGRTVYELLSAYVVFDEGRRWRDEYGNLQPPVRNDHGDPVYYRIDYVTVHEAGHIWGCSGHSSNSGDVMCEYYPHNYGSRSQNDVDTIRDLYNVRQFH
ncbi:MAG: matrixin family metalloprotease [Armatimonadota bacterium]